MNVSISNIEVNLSHHAAAEFCLSWERDGARYHVWLDREDMTVRRAIGHKTPTIYKNPPRGTKQGTDGWYQTRKMDANKHEVTIEAVLGHAKQHRLFDAAIERAKAAEDKRLAQAAAEYAEERVREAGPALLAAAKEAMAYFDAPHNSSRLSPVSRANTRDMLAKAIEEAEG